MVVKRVGLEKESPLLETVGVLEMNWVELWVWFWPPLPPPDYVLGSQPPPDVEGVDPDKGTRTGEDDAEGVLHFLLFHHQWGRSCWEEDVGVVGNGGGMEIKDSLLLDDLCLQKEQRKGRMGKEGHVGILLHFLPVVGVGRDCDLLQG